MEDAVQREGDAETYLNPQVASELAQTAFHLARGNVGPEHAIFFLVHKLFPHYRIYPRDGSFVATSLRQTLDIRIQGKKHPSVSPEQRYNTPEEEARYLVEALAGKSKCAATLKGGLQYFIDEMTDTDKRWWNDKELEEESRKRLAVGLCEYIIGPGEPPKRKVVGNPIIDAVLEAAHRYVHGTSLEAWIVDAHEDSLADGDDGNVTDLSQKRIGDMRKMIDIYNAKHTNQVQYPQLVTNLSTL